MAILRARGLTVAIDRKFIGYRMASFEVLVDAERVRRFIEAIGATAQSTYGPIHRQQLRDYTEASAAGTVVLDGSAVVAERKIA